MTANVALSTREMFIMFNKCLPRVLFMFTARMNSLMLYHNILAVPRTTVPFGFLSTLHVKLDMFGDSELDENYVLYLTECLTSTLFKYNITEENIG